MPTDITDLANADALLALPPEDLAPIVLHTVLDGVKKRSWSISADFILYRIYQSEHQTFAARFPEQRRKEIERAVAEAWHWLVSDGILMPEPGYNGKNGFMVLTSRGEKYVANGMEFRGFKGGAVLSKDMLHPSIADKVWNLLARGELDNAVFEAFKQVEIAVREAICAGPDDIGKTLMFKAFQPGTGLLTDSRLPKSEQEAQAHLFAAAIGYYKNPHSHREVKIASVQRAQEIVLFASHLLHVVNFRRLF